MDIHFLRGALFTGMTANAFKLGTVLTLGWFWPRVGGGCLLYRGMSLDEIDFGNVLGVADLDSKEISPPSYLQHEADSKWFYVARRVNSCGCLEHTLSAAVKVSIDTGGDLAKPRPNGILGVRAAQFDDDRIRLVWFYSSLDQESPPARFRIYFDYGIGQIEYEDSIANVGYAGQRYYCFETESLNVGDYLFCVRAEDAADTEGSSSAQMRVQFDNVSPCEIDVVSVETI